MTTTVVTGARRSKAERRPDEDWQDEVGEINDIRGHGPGEDEQAQVTTVIGRPLRPRNGRDDTIAFGRVLQVNCSAATTKSPFMSPSHQVRHACRRRPSQ